MAAHTMNPTRRTASELLLKTSHSVFCCPFRATDLLDEVTRICESTKDMFTQFALILSTLLTLPDPVIPSDKCVPFSHYLAELRLVWKIEFVRNSVLNASVRCPLYVFDLSWQKIFVHLARVGF